VLLRETREHSHHLVAGVEDERDRALGVVVEDLAPHRARGRHDGWSTAPRTPWWRAQCAQQ
jgi:hypothetical protein